MPEPTLLERLAGEYQSDPEYVAGFMALEVTAKCARVMRREGITQKELAARLGVSRGYVSRVFAGHINMTLKSLAKLSLALGYTPSFTLGAVARPASRLDHFTKPITHEGRLPNAANTNALPQPSPLATAA